MILRSTHSLRSLAAATAMLLAAGPLAALSQSATPLQPRPAPPSLGDPSMSPTIRLQKLLHDGDTSQNPELSVNAVVYVTSGEMIRVQVLGAVTRPGNVEVHEGDRLSMALARAGADASAKSDLNHVFLTRTDPTTGKTLSSYQIDLYQALKRGDQQYDPILRKGDKIYVPEARTISPALMTMLGGGG